MSLTKSCCTLPPVSSDYQPEGSEIRIGEMTVYETKDKSPKIMLICAYDIVGFHPNTKQFADKLNSTGLFRVVMPDFFRGHAKNWDDLVIDAAGDFRKHFMKFIAEHGSWEKTVKDDLIKVIEHYKSEGTIKFGMLGLCWGGKISARAVCELEDIKGVALIHPSMLEDKDAEDAKAPVIFLPAKDDREMLSLFEIVKRNLGEDKADHHRFDDMIHGFCGARGNWKDELQLKRVNEAIALVHSFFKKHFIG